MKTKNFIVATIAGTIVYFLLGFIFYGLLFKDIYPEHETSHGMLFVTIGSLLFTAFMTMIYMKWASISTAMTGLYAGAWIGFFYSASMNFFMYSGMEVDYRKMIIDIVGNIIITGLVGACIGFVLGKMK